MSLPRWLSRQFLLARSFSVSRRTKLQLEALDERCLPSGTHADVTDPPNAKPGKVHFLGDDSAGANAQQSQDSKPAKVERQHIPNDAVMPVVEPAPPREAKPQKAKHQHGPAVVDVPIVEQQQPPIVRPHKAEHQHGPLVVTVPPVEGTNEPQQVVPRKVKHEHEPVVVVPPVEDTEQPKVKPPQGEHQHVTMVVVPPIEEYVEPKVPKASKLHHQDAPTQILLPPDDSTETKDGKTPKAKYLF